MIGKSTKNVATTLVNGRSEELNEVQPEFKNYLKLMQFYEAPHRSWAQTRGCKIKQYVSVTSTVSIFVGNVICNTPQVDTFQMIIYN